MQQQVKPSFTGSKQQTVWLKARICQACGGTGLQRVFGGLIRECPCKGGSK